MCLIVGMLAAKQIVMQGATVVTSYRTQGLKNACFKEGRKQGRRKLCTFQQPERKEVIKKQEEYLSGHAELLLDGATIAVKVPVGSSHNPLACFGVIFHHTLHTTDQISNTVDAPCFHRHQSMIVQKRLMGLMCIWLSCDKMQRASVGCCL